MLQHFCESSSDQKFIGWTWIENKQAQKTKKKESWQTFGWTKIYFSPTPPEEISQDAATVRNIPTQLVQGYNDLQLEKKKRLRALTYFFFF